VTGAIEPGSCVLVAEVAQAHDGSLGTAHAYIDAVADAGVNAVKFQAHIARYESHPSEPWRVRFSRQDESRYDYWRRMEFAPDQWRGLYDHAHACGLEFIVSPFSLEAVDMLRTTGVDVWKVASGEVGNHQLLGHLAGDGRPVILSTGMSSWAECDAAVALLLGKSVDVTVLQCTTAYPCPPERLGLRVMHEIRDRYGVPFGLSDHTGETYAGISATALGASMVEVHVTFHKRSFGPDVPASLDLAQLADLVRGVRFVERALAGAVDKDALAEELAPTRRLFTRSLVLRRDLPKGSLLVEADLILKKPGTGIPGERMGEFVGRRLARGLAADAQLAESDLEVVV
jgi:N,N'-diacetyllegionaminate synthase